MIHGRRILPLIAAGMIATASPLIGHHSWPVDFSREITVKGTVTSYDWSNPHVMIGLVVTGSGGQAEKWNVGGPSVSRMAGNGWDRNSLTMGAVITATGYQFSDGRKILRLQKIVMPNGKEMLLYGR